jgi:hypothetical protein
MTNTETLYKTCVAGSMAGFVAWALDAVARESLPILHERGYIASPGPIADFLDFALVSSLICAWCIAVADAWAGTSHGRRLANLTIAVAGGILAGYLGALLLTPLRLVLANAPYVLTTLSAWAILGVCIGALLGLLRCGWQLWRVGVSAAGGAIGAVVGGMALTFGGQAAPYLIQAIAFSVTGVGISFGTTYAVRMIARASLVFVGSDDANVARHFRGRTSTWELARGDRYLIGSGLVTLNTRHYILVPGVDVAEAHARLEERNGHFLVKLHDRNADECGLPVWPLENERGGQRLTPSVSGNIVLAADDVIRIGTTRLAFRRQK